MAVPLSPMSSPCRMNKVSMLRLLVPNVRRKTMSRRFSMTIMMSVLLILNAATSTMNVRMMNMASFSCSSAAKNASWFSYQVSAM